MLKRVVLLILISSLFLVSPVLAQNVSNDLSENTAVDNGFNWWWLLPLVVMVPILLMAIEESKDKSDESPKQEYFGQSPITYSEIRKRKNREREVYK